MNTDGHRCEAGLSKVYARCAKFVAQICNLLYRRFAIGGRSERLYAWHISRSADCKSAIRPTLRYVVAPPLRRVFRHLTQSGFWLGQVQNSFVLVLDTVLIRVHLCPSVVNAL
jgi:hypothetical protein